MAYLQEIPRRQMQEICLESSIGADNPVGFMGAFIDHLDLSKLGVDIQTLKSTLFRCLNLNTKHPILKHKPFKQR
ncbi:MAG: hypothetical protein IPM47_19105 [Sphingobacteriales bacterium]|nr:MAG: hypothetical protein IPM47_19105 [Sphingobacteriales bacterium]